MRYERGKFSFEAAHWPGSDWALPFTLYIGRFDFNRSRGFVFGFLCWRFYFMWEIPHRIQIMQVLAHTRVNDGVIQVETEEGPQAP